MTWGGAIRPGKAAALGCRGSLRAEPALPGRRTRRLALALALLALLGLTAPPSAPAVGRCGAHPWCDTRLSPDARAGILLGALTQDEKISLLAGDDLFGGFGAGTGHTGTSDGVPRVDLPTMYYSDRPVGPRQGSATAMPVPMALAATFDPQAAYRQGGEIANEAKFQVNAVLDERTLREIYLPHFEAAVKEAHVGSVMCSYNRLNGQYACEIEHLLMEILRREWGFKGYVLSDYGASHPGGTTASLNDGLDFEPWPGWAYSPTEVNASLASGMVSPATIDEHVRLILRTMFAYGMFDRPAYRDDDSQINKAGHAQIAQQNEESAITLLQNRGALPLNAGRLKSIAVIGSTADKFTTGGGSGSVTPFFFVTPRQAITQRAGPGVAVAYNDGSNTTAAAATAKAADVAIVFAGDYESEGSDRFCLSLE